MMPIIRCMNISLPISLPIIFCIYFPLLHLLKPLFSYKPIYIMPLQGGCRCNHINTDFKLDSTNYLYPFLFKTSHYSL